MTSGLGLSSGNFVTQVAFLTLSELHMLLFFFLMFLHSNFLYSFSLFYVHAVEMG